MRGTVTVGAPRVQAKGRRTGVVARLDWRRGFAVRQLWGQSTNQVPNARVSLVASGPMVTPATDVIFGTAEVVA